MRIERILLVTTLALALSPAAAQTLPDLDKRVTRLERQVSRVAKKVLPRGEQTMIEPEIGPDTAPAAPPPPPPASAASLNDLSERVSAVERSQREITAQIEEQGNRLKQLEERLAKFQPDAEARLGKLEGVGAPPAPAATPPPPVSPLPHDTPAKGADSSIPDKASPRTDVTGGSGNGAGDDPASPVVSTPELRYRAAYKFVEDKNWQKAEPALQAFVDQYPKNKLASNARYWLGRTQYVQMKYDTAARTQFDNYKIDPKGERAQESLFWVGQSLVRLKKNKEACQVYELATKVYADTLKPELGPQFGAARKRAGCAKPAAAGR